jgi:hypothetical protein
MTAMIMCRHPMHGTVKKLYSVVTNTSSLTRAAASVKDAVLGFPSTVENLFDYPTVRV